MDNIVELNKEHTFLYDKFIDKDIYILPKNEYFPENKTFIFIGKMKFRHKVKKLKPMSTTGAGHLFCFVPKLLGKYELQVYEGNNILDSIQVEVL